MNTLRFTEPHPKDIRHRTINFCELPIQIHFESFTLDKKLQILEIKGIALDTFTHDPIPGVSIMIGRIEKGKFNGQTIASTDDKGRFFLKSTIHKNETIIFTAIGYGLEIYEFD